MNFCLLWLLFDTVKIFKISHIRDFFKNVSFYSRSKKALRFLVFWYMYQTRFGQIQLFKLVLSPTRNVTIFVSPRNSFNLNKLCTKVKELNVVC